MKVAASVSQAIQTKHHISLRIMARAISIVENDVIRPLPSGSYSVKSQSRLGVEHHVNPAYEECNCEAGKRGIVCVHLVAFLLLRAQWEYAKQEAKRTNEARVALVVKARPQRTEWIEEI